MNEQLKAYLDGAIPAVLDFLVDIIWVVVSLW